MDSLLSMVVDVLNEIIVVCWQDVLEFFKLIIEHTGFIVI